MGSPAENYARMRQRHAAASTALTSFLASKPFGLDPFQIEACERVEAGEGVLVAAPTGAGKTVVGEFAIHLARIQGKKAFYTTPIKALSNQKYRELADHYGAAEVGLLTGDTSINSEAPIVVMTTEVLRNMIYADSSTLTGLGFVIMDEVHYLADRFRGAVWEEIIIHLPESVQLVSLSATVSNAEEFGDWLQTLRGTTAVVKTSHRPVPLHQHVLRHRHMIELFSEDSTPSRPQPNPELVQLARQQSPASFGRGGQRKRQHGRGGRSLPPRAQGRGQRGPARASRPATISALARDGLLPAIVFIFSRKGCEEAVAQCVAGGDVLTTAEERAEIQRVVDQVASALPREDLDVVGFFTWREGVMKGYGAHHAGLLPLFKEAIEFLFGQQLIKAVFATETLALGVNMPARSVVLEKLDKFNGEQHVPITPGEYTQLTGRAGRRGIDTQGHAVVLWNPMMEPMSLVELAATAHYPLNSSFSPTYNMCVNLVQQFGIQRSRTILESSFAQFQADKAVVGLARKAHEKERALDGYLKSASCEHGDVFEYAQLRFKLSQYEKQGKKHRREQQLKAIDQSLLSLERGDVLYIAQGRMRGECVVIEEADDSQVPTVVVLTRQRTIRTLRAEDLRAPIQPITRMKVSKRFTGRSPKERRDLASALGFALEKAGEKALQRAEGDFGFKDARREKMRAAIAGHPVHRCPDREEHLTWANRHRTLQQELNQLRGTIKGRTSSIAHQFDALCGILERFGFLETVPSEESTEEAGREESMPETSAPEVRVTERGQVLTRIYGERDLLTALIMGHENISVLTPEEFAGLAALLVYQGRREERGTPPLPSRSLREVYSAMIPFWSELTDLEHERKLDETPAPEAGLVKPVMTWAAGSTLRETLQGTDLAAGDFVRWAKQVIDTLEQMKRAASSAQTRGLIAEAVDLMQRGVVLD